MEDNQYPGQNMPPQQPPNDNHLNQQQPAQPTGMPGQPSSTPPPVPQVMVKRTNRKIFQITDYIFWLIEGVILLRFALKLIVADPTKGGTVAGNPFVVFIYNLTSGPVRIFQGIASDLTAGTNGVFEISALFAMLVIWLIYLAVVRLLQISTS